MTKEKAVEQLVDLGMTKDEAIKEVNDICNTGIDLEHQIDFITRTTKIRPAMFIDGSDGPCYNHRAVLDHIRTPTKIEAIKLCQATKRCR